MAHKSLFVAVSLVTSFSLIAASSPLANAASPLDGTWRPEYPQKVSPERRHDLIDLEGGVYACRSCMPPYTLEADGLDHAVKDEPDYDTRSVSVVDPRTVSRNAKKNGVVVFESRLTVSEDGASLTELQT